MRYGKTIEAAIQFYKMVKTLKEGQSIILATPDETILLERKVIEKPKISYTYYDEFIDFTDEDI